MFGSGPSALNRAVNDLMVDPAGLHGEINATGEWLQSLFTGPKADGSSVEFKLESQRHDPATCNESSTMYCSQTIPKELANQTVIVRPMAAPGDVVTLVTTNISPAKVAAAGLLFDVRLSHSASSGLPATIPNGMSHMTGSTDLVPAPSVWGSFGRNVNGIVRIGCKGSAIGDNISQGSVGGAFVSDYRGVDLGSTPSVIANSVRRHSVIEDTTISDFEDNGGVVIRMGGLANADLVPVYMQTETGSEIRYPPNSQLFYKPVPAYPAAMPPGYPNDTNVGPTTGMLWISSFCDLTYQGTATFPTTIDRINPGTDENGGAPTDILQVPDYAFDVQVPCAAYNTATSAMSQSVIPVHGFPTPVGQLPVVASFRATHVFQEVTTSDTGAIQFTYKYSTTVTEVTAAPMPPNLTQAEIDTMPLVPAFGLDPVAGRDNIKNKAFFPFDGPQAVIEGMIRRVTGRGRLAIKEAVIRGTRHDDLGVTIRGAYVGTLVNFSVPAVSTTLAVGPAYFALSLWGLSAAGSLTNAGRFDSARSNDFPYCTTPFVYWDVNGQSTYATNAGTGTTNYPPGSAGGTTTMCAAGWVGGWVPSNLNQYDTKTAIQIANFDIFGSHVAGVQRTGCFPSAIPASSTTLVDPNNAVWWPQRRDSYPTDIAGGATNAYRTGFCQVPDPQPYRFSKPFVTGASSPWQPVVGNEPATSMNAAVASGIMTFATPLHGAMPALGVGTQSGVTSTYGVYGASPDVVNYPVLGPNARAWVPDNRQYMVQSSGSVFVPVSSLTGFVGQAATSLDCWRQTAADSQVDSMGPCNGMCTMFIRSSRAGGYQEAPTATAFAPNNPNYGGNAHHKMKLANYSVEALINRSTALPMLPFDMNRGQPNTVSASLYPLAQPLWYDLPQIAVAIRFQQRVSQPIEGNPYAAVIAVCSEIGTDMLFEIRGDFTTQYKVKASKVALTNQASGMAKERRIDVVTSELGRSAWVLNPALKLFLTTADYNSEMETLMALQSQLDGSALLGTLAFIKALTSSAARGENQATDKFMNHVADDARRKVSRLNNGGVPNESTLSTEEQLLNFLSEMPYAGMDTEAGNAAGRAATRGRRMRTETWRR